jgi:hypothetical protein
MKILLSQVMTRSNQYHERWLKTAGNFEERKGRSQERKNIMHAHSNSLLPEILQIFPVYAQKHF